MKKNLLKVKVGLTGDGTTPYFHAPNITIGNAEQFGNIKPIPSPRFKPHFFCSPAANFSLRDSSSP